jgi:zinc protease
MKYLFSLITLLLFSNLIYCQDSFDPTKKIPLDDAVTYGKLDNGLTYYIRHNEKPEQRAEFYLVVNAGAILEDDDQNGLAHFCEHMAFNGTKNFAKHEIIDYLRSIGMKFGPEINAFTSHDVTAYMLQKVPVETKENIDTSLMVLYDWACNVSFEGEEIDNERGVITEEWRTGRDARFRMSKETDKTLYFGSKYADRDVIGDIDIVQNATYDKYTRFYHDWYRPDLEAIIVVGDIDVAEIEKKIKTMFSKMPVVESPRERKEFEVPDHKDTKIAIATDKEARMTSVQMVIKHDANPDRTTQKTFKEDIISGLYNSMINDRYDEIARKADAPIVYAYSYYSSMLRTKDAYYSYASVKNNRALDALQIMIEENMRVQQNGFTETELERAKKSMMRRMEKSYKERDQRESNRFTWQYYSHFLENEPYITLEYNYNLTKELMPDISLEDIAEFTKNWYKEENRVIIVTGPEKEDILIPSEEEIKNTLEQCKELKLTAYEDKVSDLPFMEKIPEPGKISKEENNEDLGATKWVLSNGATVIIKQTDFKKDEIRFTAYSDGGRSLYEDKDDVSARFASQVIADCGVGNYSKTETDKYFQGKIAYVNTYISTYSEGAYGATSPTDLEDFMQLLYQRFSAPRIDKESYTASIERTKAYYENKNLDPASGLYDSVYNILNQYHFRSRPTSVETFEEINYDRLLPIYKERFADASDFTFIFVGAIDPEKAKPLIEKYIGGLPAQNKQESYKDLNIDKVDHKVEKTLKRKMENAKATSYIIYHGALESNVKNDLIMKAVNDILQVRFTETVREEESGTYGVRNRKYLGSIPKPYFYFHINFDCAVEKADTLVGVVHREIDKLKSDGPSEEDLNNFKENTLKERKESLEKNRYWITYLEKYYKFNDNYLSSEFEKIIEDMTIEDVQNIAKEMFKDDNYIQLILKPEE